MPLPMPKPKPTLTMSLLDRWFGEKDKNVWNEKKLSWTANADADADPQVNMMGAQVVQGCFFPADADADANADANADAIKF